LAVQHQSNVQQILKGGYHLLELINEVLDLARIEAGRLSLSPEPVQIKDALKEALDLVRPIASSQNITLTADFSAYGDRYVQADRQRLKQVLLNLLSNAIKFNRSNGTVVLRCEETQNGRLRIDVVDTGSGIDEETILKAIASGAKGYVDEAASPAEFAQAIRIVNQGSVWAPRRVLSMFIERVSSTPGRIFPAGRVTFTDREKEVLEMLVAGRSNKEIGAQLGIEERTVKAHVAKLMRKVGVQNRIALSVHAITHSLVTTK